jgi:N-carbamoylputrescine amidase
VFFFLTIFYWFEAQANDSTRFCIAVVQLRSSDVGNFDKMDHLAKEAKAKGAQMIVFPEESVFGWLNPVAFQKAEPIPGEYASAFVKIAAQNKIWVATGLAEEGPPINAGYHEAYDAAILISPAGTIELHYRQHNVIRNAFSVCSSARNQDSCSYTPGLLSEISVAQTPMGRIGILVCDDAYTYDTSVLYRLKLLQPDVVIVNWGVTAGVIDSCGKPFYNATAYATQAAQYLKTAYVVGANGTGNRPYGRFLPSCYCGTSGFVYPDGRIGAEANTMEEMLLLYLPMRGRNSK